jgi:hypothetical protein
LLVSRQLICAAFFALATVSMAAAGCTSDEANAVVELCGDLSVPDDIDSVRVVIYDQNRAPLRQGVRELWSCPGPTLHRLPQTLEFDPVEGDVFIEVQGLKDGAPVIRSELRTTYGAETEAATVSLTQACMGARCAAGETCIEGKCELVALAARAVSRCSLGRPTDEPDTSSDARITDAGSSTDASTDDASTDDAGTDDAGTDDTGTQDAGSTTTRPGAYLCPEEPEPEEPDEEDGSPDDAGSSNEAGVEEGSP